MKKDSGFTQVEMMVVIGITAIVSAIAIPNYLSYATGSRLRNATQELFSNVKKSQMNAINATLQPKTVFSFHTPP